MADFIHLRRIGYKMWRVVGGLNDIWELMELLSVDLTQENVDKLANKIEAFDKAVVSMKNTIQSSIKEVAGDENNEIDVEISDEGNLLT
jgi:hypothetical protein